MLLLLFLSTDTCRLLSLCCLSLAFTVSPVVVLFVAVVRPDNDYGLVWKVEGYDDRYPGDLSIFGRVGVYGTLKDNDIHDNYIGACEFHPLALQRGERGVK